MIEAGYTVEHEVFENGRFVTLEYVFDGYSSSGKGLWSYRIKGVSNWRHVNNPLIRKRLDVGQHPRQGDHCTLLWVLERLTNEQFDALYKVEHASIAFA